MPETSSAAICPMCEGTRTAQVLESGNGYPVLRCQDCHLVFTDDRSAPPPSTLYPAFDQSDSALLRRMRSALSLFLRRRAAFVQSLKPTGRVLDYGCGNGAFARYMSEHGYEAVGLEPFSLGKPHTEGKLQLIREPLESAEAKLGEFDVITLWHVLEHVPRPVKVLQTLAKHLKPDGVLVVSVPNFHSWQRQVFQGEWFHLDAPRHLIHFEPETLQGCLERAGLLPAAERRFLAEYGSSGWIQSALNRVLPHRNFLYEVVKDRGALKDMGPASSAAHLAASMAAGVPLFALSFPIEAAAALTNQTAALTVAARRQG